MTDPVPSKEWMPFGHGVDYLRSRVMTSDPSFVTEHWDCKYMDVRVDMRTGRMLIQPGNRPESSRESDYLAKLQDSHPMVQLQREVEELRRDNRRWENAHKILLADNERLRKQVGELSIHAEKWVKRATTPAHEREMPHCSTCGCGLAAEPIAVPDDRWIKHDSASQPPGDVR